MPLISNTERRLCLPRLSAFFPIYYTCRRSRFWTLLTISHWSWRNDEGHVLVFDKILLAAKHLSGIAVNFHHQAFGI